MPKYSYIVELTAYPQEFIVQADNDAEAVSEATKRFGSSVYESRITSQREL